MAEQLIDSLSADFEPEKYHDTYREQVLELIERKAAGDWRHRHRWRPRPDKVVDLHGRARGVGGGGQGGPQAPSHRPVRDGRAAPRRRPRPTTRRPTRRPRPKQPPGPLAASRPERRARAPDAPGSDRPRIDGRQLCCPTSTRCCTPRSGFTKAEVIDYYVRIAPAMLTHIGDRGVTLRRYPNGVRRQVVLREALPLPPTRVGARRARPRRPQRPIGYCGSTRVAALAWAANLAALEIHAPMARAGDIGRRRWWSSTSTRRARRHRGVLPGGAAVRDVLAALGLAALPKTAGRRGCSSTCRSTALHPRQASSFALAVAQLLERTTPGRPRHGEAVRTGRSSSTGARTPTTRRRSRRIRCGPGPTRRCRPRSLGRGGSRSRGRGPVLRSPRGPGAGRRPRRPLRRNPHPAPGAARDRPPP